MYIYTVSTILGIQKKTTHWKVTQMLGILQHMFGVLFVQKLSPEHLFQYKLISKAEKVKNVGCLAFCNSGWWYMVALMRASG